MSGEATQAWFKARLVAANEICEAPPLKISTRCPHATHPASIESKHTAEEIVHSD